MARSKKFVLHKAVNGQPYFTIVAGNGEVLMMSETYSGNQAMMDTVNSLLGKKFPIKIDDKRNRK
jgi:uncharacterized protein YegP (UPF0339 family)